MNLQFLNDRLIDISPVTSNGDSRRKSPIRVRQYGKNWPIALNSSRYPEIWRKLKLNTFLQLVHQTTTLIYSHLNSEDFDLKECTLMLRYEWRLSVNSASINGRSVLWEWVWNTFGLFYHQTYFYTILPIISMSSKPCCQKFCETISSNKGLSEKFCFNWAT